MCDAVALLSTIAGVPNGGSRLSIRSWLMLVFTPKLSYPQGRSASHPQASRCSWPQNQYGQHRKNSCPSCHKKVKKIIIWNQIDQRIFQAAAGQTPRLKYFTIRYLSWLMPSHICTSHCPILKALKHYFGRLQVYLRINRCSSSDLKLFNLWSENRWKSTTWNSSRYCITFCSKSEYCYIKFSVMFNWISCQVPSMTTLK